VYIPVRAKFAIALLLASLWTAFSLWAAEHWYEDLSDLVGLFPAAFLIGFIAIVPGFMNSFLLASLALDHRPRRVHRGVYPPITVLIAAYNEEACIALTIESIRRQDYHADIHVIVVNDGSTDGTSAAARACAARIPHLRVIDLAANGGKAHALNIGLAEVETALVVTLDADSVLCRDAIRHIVERYIADPPNTRAVAGTVLVRNSRASWITRAQEWDYFNGIAAVKRVQSLYQGTLVAQGSFSIYDRRTIAALGGWPRSVGEDIVLTWAILRAGWRVGHAEDACAFTNAPDTFAKFMHQRQRWSRGVIEAFRYHPDVIATPRLSLMFILWNLLFPLLDLAYVVGFMPGMALAFFGYFWIVGPMTLALLPIALAMNYFMYRVEKEMFDREHLQVPRNPWGFMLYLFGYGFIMQPACVAGYVSEFINAKKTWGTK
jgi:biofilm PGA synthesis N-glycosyltransferase PgaC